MSEWISVTERLPIEIGSVDVFGSAPVLATNGAHVCVCDFNAGNGAGKPWAEWSSYNDIPPSGVTHWQPLPPPPQ